MSVCNSQLIKIIRDLKVTVFWDAAPCGLSELYRRFQGTYCLHNQGVVLYFIYFFSISIFKYFISVFKYFNKQARKLEPVPLYKI
jgi:hypothetical protein